MRLDRTGGTMLKTLQGFKDFVMRGNVIDLSVGIVIGAAFTTVVTAFTKAFIEPLIRVFGGGKELSGTFAIGSTVFDWAAFVNAMITFMITAAVLYFLVVTPMNRLAERRRKGFEPEPEKPSEELLLLQEIRDALVAANAQRGIPQQSTGSQAPTAAAADATDSTDASTSAVRPAPVSTAASQATNHARKPRPQRRS
jgi:large conductance mechanosensitive channel